MTGAGSVLWMAPEVINGEIFNEKIDVYSYAMCLVEVIARKLPWTGSGSATIVPLKVSRGERPTWQLESAPAPLAELVRQCWCQEPRERPSFPQVLEKVAELQASHDDVLFAPPSVAGPAIDPVLEGEEEAQCSESAELGGLE